MATLTPQSVYIDRSAFYDIQGNLYNYTGTSPGERGTNFLSQVQSELTHSLQVFMSCSKLHVQTLSMTRVHAIHRRGVSKERVWMF